MRILTFDIEEWFHILDVAAINDTGKWNSFESRISKNIERLLNKLDERQMKATFFCLGWIAKYYPEIIKEISAKGHEIGTHSHMHQLIYQQSPGDFKEDLKTSIGYLEDITGKKVNAYRSPGFSLNRNCLWALDSLIECGIEIDCSIFPAHRAHGGIYDIDNATPFLINHNGAIIKEFPMSVWGKGIFKMGFIGGGYFRLIPYAILNRVIREKPYLMTYFHPRDFDTDQPVLKELSHFKRFKSYYGLNDSFHKFGKLIDDFDFVTLSNADNEIDWKKVEIIDL
jgi:polysaccharide deacetylase family protein (PEP-CTERM system associated)